MCFLILLVRGQFDVCFLGNLSGVLCYIALLPRIWFYIGKRQSVLLKAIARKSPSSVLLNPPAQLPNLYQSKRSPRAFAQKGQCDEPLQKHTPSVFTDPPVLLRVQTIWRKTSRAFGLILLSPERCVTRGSGFPDQPLTWLKSPFS